MRTLTDRYYEARQIRKARLLAAREKGTHTKAEWLTLVEEFDHRCVQCGRDGHVDKDHIIPLYQGGSDGLDNLQPLCAWCNARKGPDGTNWVNYRRLHPFDSDATASNPQGPTDATASNDMCDLSADTMLSLIHSPRPSNRTRDVGAFDGCATWHMNKVKP